MVIFLLVTILTGFSSYANATDFSIPDGLRLSNAKPIEISKEDFDSSLIIAASQSNSVRYLSILALQMRTEKGYEGIVRCFNRLDLQHDLSLDTALTILDRCQSPLFNFEEDAERRKNNLGYLMGKNLNSVFDIMFIATKMTYNNKAIKLLQQLTPQYTIRKNDLKLEDVLKLSKDVKDNYELSDTILIISSRYITDKGSRDKLAEAAHFEQTKIYISKIDNENNDSSISLGDEIIDAVRAINAIDFSFKDINDLNYDKINNFVSNFYSGKYMITRKLCYLVGNLHEKLKQASLTDERARLPLQKLCEASVVILQKIKSDINFMTMGTNAGLMSFVLSSIAKEAK